MKSWVVLTSAFFCFVGASCTVLDENSAPQGEAIWRLGLTRVDIDREDGGTVRDDVRTIGAWAGAASFGAGYSSHRRISLPRDCRLIFFVRDEAQAAQVRQVLSEMMGGGEDELCVVPE